MIKINPSLDFSVIRDLRKRKDMTLQQVAQKSGISIAVLSKLERNQNICELETLYRLARVFGLSASDLLGLAENCSAHTTEAVHYSSGQFDFSRIHYSGLECFHAKARAGEALSNPEAHGDDFEICWVITGSIEVELPLENHILTPGEAVQFDAVLEHSYRIIEDAEVFIIHLKKTHRF